MSTFKKLRRHESKALRSYWSIHSEAWIRSAVSLKEYCDEHRLDRMTMKRWLTVLETPVPRRRRVEKKPIKVNMTRLPATGSRAFLAFWLMHIEALRASGLPATDYANVHRLPARKLQVLRRRFALTPPVQEWRGLLHPSVPPSAAEANLGYELRYDGASTACADADVTSAPTNAAVEMRKRRQFTDKQKLAIVAEAADPEVTVSEVARRHGVIPAMIFRWRSQFGFTPNEHALLITARAVKRPTRGRPKQSQALVLHDLLPMPDGMMVVELADGRRVFAPSGNDAEAVRQYVTAQENAR